MMDQEMTVAAIHAYSRVLELHLKAVEQGANPMRATAVVEEAAQALDREVKWLRFQREKTYREQASHDVR